MFDWSVIAQNIDLIGVGLLVTLKYTVVTCVLGLMIGLVVALAQLTEIRLIRLAGRLFVEFFRNVPLLVWLLWSYYALPIFAGINISKEAAAILALSLYGASYYAEILRAGIQSLDAGQNDAARALGMSPVQAMRRIILPQAFRNMIPPLAGQTIIQMKNTTLLSVITVPDLLYQASYVASFTYRPMEIYTAIGIVFLIILIPSNYLARKLEAHQR
ncbi:Glutamate/aspartate transport system permease protein GltK [Hartmannibacter diazotrophicus]|uniref:Glutamate/aspartate transport system permease protein GltK n=1 Tax=Hartmannibacter diazotrophicus TaxID=1482074 RepID=A0A2C9D277_9HYPH|nr:amino acid ABC transporter permease [Hartmannibacter diazotrophicus]SON54350.1 Glutamate/aspartate transport system permease protein GltK [Hartmannibacter diazotrophicus]